MKVKLKTKLAYSNSKNGRRISRHAFLFEIGEKVKAIYADVVPARRSVTVTLTAEHVKRAIKNNGYGNAQQCAGALCVKDHAGIFPHKFSGYADWFDRRVYVASRNNSLTNLPEKCVAYSHRDNIAKMFDSQAGKRKLLAHLEEHGPMQIILNPPTYQTREGVRPAGRKTGVRTKGKGGHRIRMQRVKLGSVAIGA